MTATATPGREELIASVAPTLEGHSFGLRQGEHHEEVAARIVDDILRRLAAKPADEGVRRLLKKLDYLKIDCEAWSKASGIEAAEVRAVRNIIIRIGDIRNDLAALSTTGEPKR
jgi:hypothetical protein